MQAKILTESMVGMDKDKICEALSQLKHEDEAYHERIVEYLAHEDGVENLQLMSKKQVILTYLSAVGIY